MYQGENTAMSLLGIDVGTTGCKVIAFREDGTLLAQAYGEYPLTPSASGMVGTRCKYRLGEHRNRYSTGRRTDKIRPD